MSESVPKTINGARVLLYSSLDERHRATGACRHTVTGAQNPTFSGLVICQEDGANDVYLYYCDENWIQITDTWHLTLDDAMRQAEFEYEGISGTWEPSTADHVEGGGSC